MNFFWTRSQLKQQAKDVLKRSYWMAFAICLVAGILGGGGGGFSFNFSNSSDLFSGQAGSSFPMQWVAVFLSIFAGIFAITLAISIFVSNPVTVGMSRWFNHNCRHAKYPDFGLLFSAFRKETYLKTVGAMAWYSLVIFLWSLLFIIPGIVAGYRYYFVPWILADNPHIHYKRAMELSKNMTMGHKGQIFVLSLSFLGWIFLGVLACGVGVLFVTPYIIATDAELYAMFRYNAVTNGLCTYEELGFPPMTQTAGAQEAPQQASTDHYQEP